uniref:Uncharacterized protein n=1 Tax=Anopheles culicifacies TaxID=139723 RepID=A0A182MP82_9DIPT
MGLETEFDEHLCHMIYAVTVLAFATVLERFGTPSPDDWDDRVRFGSSDPGRRVDRATLSPPSLCVASPVRLDRLRYSYRPEVYVPLVPSPTEPCRSLLQACCSVMNLYILQFKSDLPKHLIPILKTAPFGYEFDWYRVIIINIMDITYMTHVRSSAQGKGELGKPSRICGKQLMHVCGHP